ncbi:hypothetical protein C440_06027 [Haloferax mucosum ATCC BAA-1512]|uniref:CARDB domain-containing protein n=1 Tax=Haloferax mucosum ATCC BAA-1512 TaxID=662479 RepID=M0IK33_9EURY|nr:CARDB domain-containing protein [Haloferax mucosum]ELZ95824.1 hypothetical protein C440_06027 [Haloferax mucosum ATCC BAA-1512]
MKRVRLLSLVVLCAVALNAGLAGVDVASADQTSVSISGVRTAPTSPSPGQDFTVTANISNMGSSGQAVELTDVYVRGPGGTDEHGRVENVGSIAPGNTISVPVSLSLDETGSHYLRVHAVVKTRNGGHRHFEYPVLVTVTDHEPVLVSVQASESAAESETPVNVTVANGDAKPISSVEVQLSGNGSATDPKRITGSIEPGVDRSFRYNVTFDDPGAQTLSANVTYKTSGGTIKTVTDETTFDVVNESAGTGNRIDGKIRLVGVEASGSGIVTVQGDAANVGGSNVKSVLLRVKDTKSVSPMGASGEYFVGAVNDSKFDTFELIARTESNATEIPIRVRYLVDGEQKTETVRVNLSSAQGPSRPAPQMDREPPERPSQVRDTSSSGGSFNFGGIVVPLLVVVGLVGGVYTLWKRR